MTGHAFDLEHHMLVFSLGWHEHDEAENKDVALGT